MNTYYFYMIALMTTAYSSLNCADASKPVRMDESETGNVREVVKVRRKIRDLSLQDATSSTVNKPSSQAEAQISHDDNHTKRNNLKKQLKDLVHREFWLDWEVRARGKDIQAYKELKEKWSRPNLHVARESFLLDRFEKSQSERAECRTAIAECRKEMSLLGCTQFELNEPLAELLSERRRMMANKDQEIAAMYFRTRMQQNQKAEKLESKEESKRSKR